MIYTPDGRTIRRKAGFCDNPFEVVYLNNSEGSESSADLVGSFVPESDVEVEMMDQKQEQDSNIKKGKDQNE